MVSSKIEYTGQLHTKATHLRSGAVIETDAPVDNQGKGEAFSPTDLVAAATASCMLTTMGIVARKHGWDIVGAEIDVIKVMADHPRRIAEIHTSMRVPAGSLTEEDKKILEHSANTCPVVLSLSPEIKKVMRVTYF